MSRKWSSAQTLSIFPSCMQRHGADFAMSEKWSLKPLKTLKKEAWGKQCSPDSKTVKEGRKGRGWWRSKPQAKSRLYRHLPLPMPDIANGSQHSCSTNLDSTYESIGPGSHFPVIRTCLLSELRSSIFKFRRVSVETSWYYRNLTEPGSQGLSNLEEII